MRQLRNMPPFAGGFIVWLAAVALLLPLGLATPGPQLGSLADRLIADAHVLCSGDLASDRIPGQSRHVGDCDNCLAQAFKHFAACAPQPPVILVLPGQGRRLALPDELQIPPSLSFSARARAPPHPI